MKHWSLKDIVENARLNSPYYSELYKHIDTFELSRLPIVDQKKFWSSELLTTKFPRGIIFKSGGSTGSPKHSYFTNEEWKSFTNYFGHGMSQGILSTNDKVANLFYVGDMYASFLFIKDSLESIPDSKMNLTHFPIGGGTDPLQVLKTMNDFNINVIAGVPTAILNLLQIYQKTKDQYPKLKIEKILYGGEELYPDQEIVLKNIFPQLKISSIGLASVDGGLLGYSSLDCQHGEHRVFDNATIIEIVNPETLEVINETNIAGKVLLTNLTRKLMPIIRYPAGDMAMWMEKSGSENRKFILQGRAEESARLGTITVSFEESRELIHQILPKNCSFQFQMRVTHFSHLDELAFVISAPDLSNLELLQSKILQSFKIQKLAYEEALGKKLIHPLKIEFIKENQLEINPRTGKLKRIIDRR